MPVPPSPRALPIVLLFVLAAGIAVPGLWPTTLAAQSKPSEPPPLPTRVLVDPIDGARFEVSVVGTANGLGGWDGDGCTYSRGLQPRATAIATSPTTLYSARLDRWDRPLDNKQKAQLLGFLSMAGSKVDDPSQLAAFQRYEIAARIATALGDSPEDVGELYLIGAWTVRDSIVGFMPSIQGTGDAWAKLKIVREQAKSLTDNGIRTRAMFDIARLCHRGGFTVERDAFLNSLDAIPDAGLGAIDKRNEFYRRALDESRLLAEARQHFDAAIRSGTGKAVDQADWRWLRGEIGRRLGDYDAAKKDLQAVVDDATAREETRAYARDILAVLAVQARPGATAP